MPRDKLHLTCIREAADRITRRLASYDVDRFTADDVMQDAVLQQLIVIGEAAGRVSDDVRQRYTQVPWSVIRAFRNFAVHNYPAIDWIIVWNAATRSVPLLSSQISAILAAEFPDADDTKE
jgi:uncharacterized protein with HEPN domain